jgi:hypothetical protein
MKHATGVLHLLIALMVTACLNGYSGEAKPAAPKEKAPAPPKVKTPEEIEAEKQKAVAAALEKQKKEEEAKKKAEAAKKLAEEKAKKAEEARKKKEEALKKATDFKTWTAKNFNDIKQRGEPMCVYIKDTSVKDNKADDVFESASVLGSGEFRDKVLGFQFSKLAMSDKHAPSYPADWVARAKKGAALIIMSGDMARLVIFDAQNVNPKTLMTGLEEVRRQQDSKKIAMEEQKKKEDEIRKAKFAEEVAKSKAGDIPGLDKTAANKKDPKKPAKKPDEPVDE